MRHRLPPAWPRLGFLVAFAAAVVPGQARAERADRSQETLIVADHQTVDDLKQVSVFTGHVVLTKGTIRVTGDRMEYREDAEGYQYAIVTAGEDALATFHQRRDPTRPGIEETIDGVAERIEYDNRADTVKLFTRAVVRRLENGVTRDEFTGDQIVYDARTSHYDLTSPADRSAGRVTARIAPRNPQPAASTEAPSKADAASKADCPPKAGAPSKADCPPKADAPSKQESSRPDPAAGAAR
jgi:lipopolysaccharide export system protein LptA